APRIVERFGELALEAERQDRIRRSDQMVGDAAERFGWDESRKGMAKGMAGGAVNSGMRAAANITVEVLPPETSLDEVKSDIAKANPRSPLEDAADQRIALVVIGPE